MTDLQVKYQTLLETQRANRKAEELRGQEVDVKSRSVAVSEGKLPYETGQLASQTKLNEQNLDKVLVEIEKIKADTSLSEAKKKEAISNTVKNYAEVVSKAVSALGNVAGVFTGLL